MTIITYTVLSKLGQVEDFSALISLCDTSQKHNEIVLTARTSNEEDCLLHTGVYLS